MILKSTNFSTVKIKQFKDLRDAIKEKEFINSANSLKITGLPEWLNKSFQVQNYTVNPGLLTCSCKDYQELSELYPVTDTRRVCRHLFWLLQEKTNICIEKMVLAILNHQHKFGVQHLFIAGIGSQEVILSIGQNNYWVSFFFIQEGQVQQYSYNPEEDRWSYNNIPQNSKDLLYLYEALILD